MRAYFGVIVAEPTHNESEGANKNIGDLYKTACAEDLGTKSHLVLVKGSQQELAWEYKKTYLYHYYIQIYVLKIHFPGISCYFR